MFDLIIDNGLIIDGTGSPGYYGKIAIIDNKLSIIREHVEDLKSKSYIDASNKVVSPGFIDLHSHAGLTILGEPHHDPKIRQGVTTELVGIDGISHAPFKTKDELHKYIWLDSGLNGYPPLPANWLTVAELLNQYDNKVAVNIAYILGNSPVRIWTIGWNNKPASKSDINNMQSVVREAMEEGAWGLSTGLDYPPGSYANTEELIKLAETSAKMGGFYHTHTRASLSKKGYLEPWNEAIEIGYKSGSPVHLTHYRQSAQGKGSHLDYLQLVEDAQSNGMDVTFDCYSYPYSGTAISIVLPPWTKDGGPEKLISALKDTNSRKKMTREISTDQLKDSWLTNFNNPKNKQYDGKLLTHIAELRNQSIHETLFDLLLEENLGVSVVGLGTNQHTLPAFVSHPSGMIASDAILFGEYPNPRSYGCFPLVLAEFVRAEQHLKLPEAIRKMTSFPAQRLGLSDRGLIKDGFKADIVIFDPKEVKTYATRDNPKQYPIGIDYVIVNGQIIIDNGENTGILAGKALRRGKLT